MIDKYCTACGTKLTPNAQYCMTCEAAIPAPPADSRDRFLTPAGENSSQGNSLNVLFSLISGFAVITLFTGFFMEGVPLRLAIVIAVVLWLLSTFIRIITVYCLEN